MRAMVLAAPKSIADRPLELREIPTPAPAAGQVRIRVRVCGLCHTDLHTVEGELALPTLPIVPGHQVVGIVEAAGAGVNHIREGERVGVPWLHWTDGSCSYCRAGNENLCEQARFTGLHVNGGYAAALLAFADF